MQTLPKHTERSQVTPRINSERCNVETKSENSYALNSQNSWQMKLKENSTLKQNVHYIRADTRGVIWKARPGLSVTQKKSLTLWEEFARRDVTQVVKLLQEAHLNSPNQTKCADHFWF